MKLSQMLGSYPASRPLNADQIIEFHAARLLLLILLCGRNQQISGLTKLAKLDFFVRYPAFFNRVLSKNDSRLEVDIEGLGSNESAMIRHHYGPWDPRYYQVLAYLEGRDLIVVNKEEKAFIFSLTSQGSSIAKRFAEDGAFEQITTHMKRVGGEFGKKTGHWLKNLIYRVFAEEVAELEKGEVIR